MRKSWGMIESILYNNLTFCNIKNIFINKIVKYII